MHETAATRLARKANQRWLEDIKQENQLCKQYAQTALTEVSDIAATALAATNGLAWIANQMLNELKRVYTHNPTWSGRINLEKAEQLISEHTQNAENANMRAKAISGRRELLVTGDAARPVIER